MAKNVTKLLWPKGVCGLVLVRADRAEGKEAQGWSGGGMGPLRKGNVAGGGWGLGQVAERSWFFHNRIQSLDSQCPRAGSLGSSLQP